MVSCVNWGKIPVYNAVQSYGWWDIWPGLTLTIWFDEIRNVAVCSTCCKTVPDKDIWVCLSLQTALCLIIIWLQDFKTLHLPVFSSCASYYAMTDINFLLLQYKKATRLPLKFFVVLSQSNPCCSPVMLALRDIKLRLLDLQCNCIWIFFVTVERLSSIGCFLAVQQVYTITHGCTPYTIIS